MPEVFADRDLRGARFVRSTLAGAVMRGVEVDGMDVDSPWLLEEQGSFFLNGVDVAPYVDAELDRRFPGRADRKATDPDGLRAAYDRLQSTWDATVRRAEAMPAGTVDVQVDGEWSFAQTLRHLVMATDVWLRKAVLGVEQPYDPLGIANAEFAEDGGDTSVFTDRQPTWAEVLEARAAHVAEVRAFLADVTPEVLAEPRRNPWAPEHEEDVLHCLRTILEEEWEHHRYAVRDLDRLRDTSDD